jgi:N-acetylglucosamine kinase-like BadF-type ATPase
MTRVVLKPLRYVIGIDGGATKTVALIGTENGNVLGRGESGPSNYHNIGATAATAAIRLAVRKARQRAGIRSKAEVAVVALAAVDSPKDKATARRLIRSIRIARKSLVVHDSLAALQAATRGRPGIVVISGTGCVAAGLNEAGQYVRAGGWGYLIDDEGSAYDIGAKALRSAFRMLDGRSPDTKLTPALMRRFRVKTLGDALRQIYSGKFGVDGIAGLTPLVSKLASGDGVCRRILNDAGVSLAELACVVAKRLKMRHDAFTFSLVGGTFKAGRYLLQPFRARIKKEYSRAKIEIIKIEPAMGAFSLAVSEVHATKVFKNNAPKALVDERELWENSKNRGSKLLDLLQCHRAQRQLHMPAFQSSKPQQF